MDLDAAVGQAPQPARRQQALVEHVHRQLHDFDRIAPDQGLQLGRVVDRDADLGDPAARPLLLQQFE